MTNYWKERLPIKCKRIYEDIVSCAMRGGDINLNGLSMDLVSDSFLAVLNDNPQLFWISPEYQIRSQSLKIFSQTMILNRLYGSSEIKKIRCVTDALVAKVKGRNALETERKIALHIIRNTKYSIDNLRNQNMAACLYNGTAQCSGIARAVKFLCDSTGIWCIVVTGTLNKDQKAEPHAWNIVCIEGKYYHLDMTVMLASNEQIQDGKVFYAAFNCSDVEMSGYIWDRSTTPKCATHFEVPFSDSVMASHNFVSHGGCEYNSEANNLTEFGNLSGVRAFLVQNIAAKKTKITLRLTMQIDSTKRMEVMKNCLRMAQQTLNVGFSAMIETVGDIYNITLKYI